ncbi:MAG: winged helix-turn-helix domain-containing protein [Nitrososphaeraceae archaeon]
MKYRSRTEIVAMILEAANGGVTKTKIMYKGFSELCTVKRIPLCANCKQLVRIFRRSSNVQDN